jgi:succinoglycan biosynthesis transport protein ExoP
MNLPPITRPNSDPTHGRGPQAVIPRGEYRPAWVEPAINVGSPSGRDGSIADYFLGLWRRKFIVLLAMIAFGAVALVISLHERPLYQAKTSLEVMELNDSFLNRKEVDPNAAPNMTSTESYLQTQIRLLQSRTLVERVVKKLKLDENPIYAQEPPKWMGILKFMRPADPVPDSPLKRAVDECRAHLAVDSPGDSRVLDIVFDSVSPTTAATFVNTLVDEYIEQSIEVRWEATQRTGVWLTKQLQETKQSLTVSEAHLQDYARSQGLLYTNEKENVAQDRLKLVQEDLAKAQSERMSAESQYRLLGTTSADTLPKILDDGTLREYQVKLEDLRRQLSELSVSLTPAHEKVQRVQAQITELETTLHKAQSDMVNRIRNEYFAAQAKERMLQQSYDHQAVVVGDQAAKSAQFDLLRHEVDATRQMYEGMLQKVQEAGVASAISASNLRVVDYANPPASPYKPRTPLNVAMGSVAGLFFGLTFVSIRYHSGKASHVSKDLSAQLGVPELGIIPSAKSDRGLSLRRSRVELAASARSSMLAASFQSTLLSILYSAGGDKKGQVLAVTSPGKGEGKTTTASNLAIALAGLHPDVLLIDGDLRHPRLHQIFGISNQSGLAELLMDPRPLEDVTWNQFAKSTHIRGLSVLPAGCLEDDGLSEALYSNRLEKVLAFCRERFSAVVIDTPPILLFPDARIFARQADGVALVVRANKTNHEWAAAAHQRLDHDGATMLGVIINDYTYGGSGDPYVEANYYRSPRSRSAS